MMPCGMVDIGTAVSMFGYKNEVIISSMTGRIFSQALQRTIRGSVRRYKLTQKKDIHTHHNLLINIKY
jgi:hypothetical protein